MKSKLLIRALAKNVLAKCTSLHNEAIQRSPQNPRNPSNRNIKTIFVQYFLLIASRVILNMFLRDFA